MKKLIIFVGLLALSMAVTTQFAVSIETSDENKYILLNIDRDKLREVIEAPPTQPVIRPTPIIRPIIRQVLFDEDLVWPSPISTIESPHMPLGLQAQFNIEYKGAFRVTDSSSSSNSNFAVGTLGYNSRSDSLFIAGHAHHNAIAEFKIPDILSFSANAKEIVNAETLQPYTRILDGIPNNKITGMLEFNGSLVVTSEIWYDGSGSNKDNIFTLDLDNISRHTTNIAQLNGAARIAGYMSKIPESYRKLLGGDYLVGWASNYSITSRYSQGPSLAVFNPQDVVDGSKTIPSNIKQVYPMESGKKLHPQGNNNSASVDEISPLWTNISKARYGFIVPDSNTFMVVGSTGGLHGGLGYKITQDTGRLCGGGCTRIAADNYNYFWLYNVKDILTAENPWDARPYSYGKFILPYDGQIIGAVFDNNETLYISVGGAGQTGRFDRPPLILAYSINAKQRFHRGGVNE